MIFWTESLILFSVFVAAVGIEHTIVK